MQTSKTLCVKAPLSRGANVRQGKCCSIAPRANQAASRGVDRVIPRASKGVEDATKTQPISGEWAQEVASEIVDTTRSDFGRRGEAWFAAQVVALLLVAFPPAALTPVVDAAGVGAMLGGLALAVAGQQALGTNLTPLPKPRDSSQLVTTGIYGTVRHPMYGGLLLIAAGLTLATGDEARLVMTALSFLVLDRKASYEEGLLAEKFGEEEYERYKGTTKKLIPYIY